MVVMLAFKRMSRFQGFGSGRNPRCYGIRVRVQLRDRFLKIKIKQFQNGEHLKTQSRLLEGGCDCQIPKKNVTNAILFHGFLPKSKNILFSDPLESVKNCSVFPSYVHLTPRLIYCVAQGVNTHLRIRDNLQNKRGVTPCPTHSRFCNHIHEYSILTKL